MRLTCRSLALSLDEVIENKNEENDIINDLIDIKNKYKNFKVFFVHKSMSQKDIKKFISRHSNDLIKLNSEITKSKIQYVWFNINLDNSVLEGWRYSYRGSDIKNGIKNIIHRELGNFECQINGDITNAVDVLTDYGISKEEVKKEYVIFYQKCIDNDWF